MQGSTASDITTYAVIKDEMAMYIGHYQASYAYVGMRNYNNGSQVFLKVLGVVTTRYNSIGFYREDGFIYAIGDLEGTLDGVASSAVRDTMVTRYWFVNGTRDVSWKIVTKTAGEDEFS